MIEEIDYETLEKLDEKIDEKLKPFGVTLTHNWREFDTSAQMVTSASDFVREIANFVCDQIIFADVRPKEHRDKKWVVREILVPAKILIEIATFISDLIEREVEKRRASCVLREEPEDL